MAETSQLLEGVFAISKPPSLSSAQVLRDLQQHFAKSNTFAPLLEEVTRRYDGEDRRYGKRRRRDPDSVFKMGHGGTLDPLATGVLIVGIGRGTKHLQNFLGCTKQYDTVVLFGKSTDTYDVMGKIVGEAPSMQITKEMVEEKLARFRGDIKQVPPIYSALKIDGMKAYDYARTGKELPRELESRDMRVDVCELVEYYNKGDHDFRWPVEEAPEEEKVAVSKLLRSAGIAAGRGETSLNTNKSPKKAQQSSEEAVAQQGQDSTEVEATRDTPVEPVVEAASVHIDQIKNPLVEQSATSDLKTKDATPKAKHKSNQMPPESKAALHTHALPTLSPEAASSPAARVTLTVSSGFYVRSFAHDLGISLDSYGLMAELTRSRQGDYIIPSLSSQFPDLTPTLTYDDLEAGEDRWGPILTAQLEKWIAKNPLPGQTDAEGNIRPDDRDRDRRNDRRDRWSGGGGGGYRGNNRQQQGGWRHGNKSHRGSSRGGERGGRGRGGDNSEGGNGKWKESQNREREGAD